MALAALERAVETARAAGAREVDVEAAEDALQRKALLYDREGDRHYDYISAWIKATRGSDVDASIYYLAVMLEGGEDPRFIARRMVIFASEDVGNADPQALLVATAAAQAVDRVGLPECALNLAPGRRLPGAGAEVERLDDGDLDARCAHVREHGAAEPPPYLQDAHYPGAKKLGRGEGYVYPHDEPGGVSGPAARARGVARRALLRADRPRLRGRAARAPRAAARAARPRRRPISAQVKGVCARARRRNLPERACSVGRLTLRTRRFAGAGA